MADDFIDRCPGIATEVKHRAVFGTVHGCQVGLDDICDISKIADLASIAVDIDFCTGENRFDENVKSHVRPLAGAVNGEKAQGGQRQAKFPVVNGGQVFGGEFGYAVGREGAGGMPLTGRALDCAVN